MLRSRSLTGLVARALVVSMLVASVPAAEAMGQSPAPEPATPVSLAIPTDAERAANRALQPDDALPVVAETYDPYAEQEAANAAFDVLDPADWDVAGMADALGADVDAAFALVRDRIGFDAYAGSLRGAEGALSSRSGNAVDRALLLQSLLVTAGIPARLAFGELDPATAQSVLDRSLQPVADPLPSVEGLGLRPAIRSDVGLRARRDHALLRAALDEAGVLPADAGTADAAAALPEVAHHAWVQAQVDGAWVDLDPTLPSATPGTALATAASTADTLPAELAQTVTIRLIAETSTDGALAPATVLEQTLPAATVADRQVLLLFGASSGGGGGLLSVGGPDVVIPVLSIDGETIAGEDLVVSADIAGGLLGGSSQVDLASLVLEVQTDGPSLEPVISRTTILDRVPAAAREAGTFDRASLDPVAGPATLPYALQSVRHLMVSTGGVSPRVVAWQRALAAEASQDDVADPAAAAKAPLARTWWPVGVAEQELVVGSELDAIPAVDDEAVRAFAARPRVYVSSYGVSATDPAKLSGTTDLAIDPLRILARPGADAATVADHQLWYGALQTAIETEVSRRLTILFDPDTTELVGISLGVRGPLTVLGAADLAGLPVGVAPTLVEALGAGAVVLVAGDPGVARTWWEVRADGSTRSVLAPSFGGVGRVGGPGGGGRVPPPRPVNPNPNNPNPKPPKPRNPAPPRTGATRPTEAKCQGGQEYAVLNRCISFLVKLTIEQAFWIGFAAATSIVVAGLVAMFNGGL